MSCKNLAQHLFHHVTQKKASHSKTVILCFISWQTNLSSVQCYGGQRQSGDMQGAVLHKATDVTHCPPKHPGAVHKSDLRETTNHNFTKKFASIKEICDIYETVNL